MNIFLEKLENQKRELETEIKTSKLNDGSNNNGSGQVSGSDNVNNHSETPKSDNKFSIDNKFNTDIYIKSFNDIKNQIRAKKWWEFWKKPKNKVFETQNLVKKIKFFTEKNNLDLLKIIKVTQYRIVYNFQTCLSCG